MKFASRSWPKGERYRGFFQGGSQGLVTLRVGPRAPLERPKPPPSPLFSAPVGTREREIEECEELGRQIAIARGRVATSRPNVPACLQDYAGIEARVYAYVCGDFHPDKEVPDHCEGCTRPLSEHDDTI